MGNNMEDHNGRKINKMEQDNHSNILIMESVEEYKEYILLAIKCQRLKVLLKKYQHLDGFIKSFKSQIYNRN